MNLFWMTLMILTISLVYTFIVSWIMEKFEKQEIKRIKLKDLPRGWWYDIDLHYWLGNDKYDWKSLIDSMDMYGYDTERGIISYGDRKILNGYHRLAVLKRRYGLDHEIEAEYVTQPIWAIVTLIVLLAPVLTLWSPLIILYLLRQKLKIRKYG